MKTLILTLLISSSSWAASYDQAAWEAWKKETYDKYLTSPTSFLNATSLVFAKPDQRLYLAEGKTRAESKWQNKPVSGFAAVARNSNQTGVLTRPAQKDVVVDGKDKRFNWTLSNGAIAELVYGSSSGKIWGYVYDPDQIKSFTGFRFYPFSNAAIVEGIYHASPRKNVSYKTVQGDQRQVAKLGTVDFTLHGQKLTLNAYNWQDEGEKIDYLALIYTDLKGGSETYGGGRELAIMLDGELKDGQKMTLDFNRTTNFYCAHSPYWHCPTGLQQKINVEVNAGEMLPIRKIVQKRI